MDLARTVLPGLKVYFPSTVGTLARVLAQVCILDEAEAVKYDGQYGEPAWHRATHPHCRVPHRGHVDSWHRAGDRRC